MFDQVRQVGQCWKSGVSQLLELKLAVSVKGVYLGLVLSLHVRTVRQVAWNIQAVNKLPSAASNNTTFGPRLFLPNLHIIPHTFPRSSKSASKVKIYQPKHDGEWKVFPVTKELVFDWLWWNDQNDLIWNKSMCIIYYRMYVWQNDWCYVKMTVLLRWCTRLPCRSHPCSWRGRRTPHDYPCLPSL